MKKTTKQISTQEIEFETPCYIKFGESRFYKILNEVEVVTINIYHFSTHIEIVHLDQCDPFGNYGWEFTTAEEFKKAFDIALNKISELKEFPSLIYSPESQPA